MNSFKEKVVQEIIRLGKKNHSLRMPALVLAALFLVAYHSVRNFFLEFRYHPVRQRILVGILVLSLLAGQIGIINVFAESEGGTTIISAFLELSGDIREQTVPVGTALEELTLPDTLEAVIVVQESEEPSEDTGEGTKTEEPSDGDETDTENNDGDTEETPEGEESEQEETDTDTEETPEGEEDGQEETDTDTEETLGGEENGQEETEPAEAEMQAETQSFVMPEYQAENVIEVETLEEEPTSKDEESEGIPEIPEETENTENSQTDDTDTVTITDITWQSEPEYDGNTEGVYIFTAVLPEGYMLAEGMSLPEITVTVEDSDTALIQTLLERIAALPDAQEYMEKEPDIDDWEEDADAYEEAYEEWMEGLYAYAEEALAIWEEYKALTREQQAQIPEEALNKLTAWVELAEQLSGNSMMMAAVTVSPGTISSNQEWGAQTLTAGTYTINPGVTVTVTGKLTVNGNVTINGGGKLVRGSSYKGSSSSASSSCILYVSGGTLTLENVTVDGNDVEAYGPAVYISSGTVNMKTDAVIQNNINMNTGGTGVDAAGGIYCEGTLNIDGGAIKNCRTSKVVGSYAYAHAGGGVYLKSGNLNMTAGSITDNGASNGGGIYLASDGATLKLSGGIISGNSATAAGNGIYYSTKNAATSKVYISGDANVKDTIYLDNTKGSLYPYITSALRYPITLSCSSREEGRVLAGGINDGNKEYSKYNLTGVDASKISMQGTGLYSQLDTAKNQILLSATEESEATWQESAGGTWKTGKFTTALANVYNGGTIKLLTDIVISEKAEITKAVTITSDNASAPCVMTRMPSGEYGNITISGNGNLTLTNVIYDGNRDYLQGAAEASKQSLIKIENGASLTLGNGAVVRNGYKTDGSGLFAVYGTMTMNAGAVIENCEVTGTGGGVWVSSSGTFTMNGGTIHGCKAGGGGSAISIDGTCTLNGGSITGNTDTSDKDCAVYLRNAGGKLTLNGISISGNTYSVYNGDRSVTVAGDSTLSGSIYTTNAITASGNAVSNLTKTYAITLASPAVGDTVVNGSKDTQHYKLENTGYGLRTAADGSSKLVVAQPYKVSFDKNGGTGTTNAIDVLCGGAYGQLPMPTRTGHTFDGWYTAATGGSKVTATTTVTNTAAHTLYAHWIANTYTVTYNKNSGTIANESSYTSYTYGTGLTLPTPTRTGYTFGGWYENSSFTSTAVTSISGTATGNKTYWAKWTANAYTVTYNKSGGTIADESKYTSYTYGKGLTLPTPTRTGYTFGGWYENSNFTGTAVTSISNTITGDKTFYAKWTAGQYKVTFDYQGATGGSGTAEKTVTYDSAYGALPTPQKTGYTFKGWYTQAGGQGVQVTAQTTVATANAHTLFAYWKDETPPDAPALQDGVSLPAGWTSTQASIPLKLYDGVGVTELWVKADGGDYAKVDGFSSGSTTYSYTVRDGEHTYQFKAKDAAGNESAESAVYTVKLDKTPPVIDLTNMSVESGAKNLWNWIIGKKSMIIKIPTADITDALSGIAEVTYTATPDSGAQQTVTISAKGGYYEIVLNAEFTGTIGLTAKDNAGNTTQVSLTADGGKVIAEDYAPVVTVTLPDTPMPNASGWYTTSFEITVSVTDDKDSGSAAITSGGIAEIKWKDGENGAEQTVSGLPGNAPVYEKEFTIQAADGTHTYYINAVDNAGNESGWKTVTVSLDTTAPAFSGNPGVTDRTQENAEITFTPSEGGKVYWIVDAGTKPGAQEVAEGGARNGNEKDVTGGTQEIFTVGGFLPGTTHKVYVVLEDAVGNLSEVKEVSFTTLQAAPEITQEDIVIDHEKETVKLPDGIGEVEVYTNPSDPSGSKIQPEADGSLPVEPGTSIYIRYPEKAEGGMTTPASDSVKIDIPDEPAPPVAKQVTVTDKAVTVTNPAAGEEYVLVEKGQTPDWSNPNTTGQFEGINPNTEYDLYVRKKATEDSFASEPVKTEIRTYVTIKEPVITGEGAGEESNTASKPDVPDADGGTVTFTGTYGEEYTPVLIVGGQEMNPGAEMTWDEGSGKGEWEYTHDIPDGASEVEITVEFRKRSITGLTVTPDTLTIYADDDANMSMDALISYLEENSSVKAEYDNKTKGTVEADYTAADSFVQKGAAYNYTVSASGKTKGIILTVSPVTAAAAAPDALMQRQKNGGYSAQEVNAWLPTQVTVTYTGDGYTAKTESRMVTWNTDSIGTGFGAEQGRKTISGTVNLPAWATGQDSVSIVIEFVDKTPLTDNQMKLSISGWAYGAQTAPNPKGNITVTDKNPAYTYLYSADNGDTWVTAENLPKSASGHIVPGEYRVKMTYTGDSYTGIRTASFTVSRKPLEIQKGTLEAENRNYDGTTDATLKEGGQPELSGVITGDTVTLGGTLSAAFTNKGPKKNIPVTVTGFELEGRDAGYYELKNTTLTLYATINNADGTQPSGGNGGGSGGGNSGGNSGGNGSDDNDGGNDNNGGSTPEDNSAPSAPAVAPPEVTLPAVTPLPVMPPADTPQSAPGTEGSPDKITEIQPIQQPEESPEQGAEPKNTDTDTPGQDNSDSAQTVQASIVDDRIIISGGTVETGNIMETSEITTLLEVGDGTVIVTVVCKDGRYAAGVKDTAAVASAVLTPEQIQLINDGETIEVRIDVEDISATVTEQDKEVIESGLVQYRKEMPNLTIGMYVDISMFIRIGVGDWNTVTATKEPIEVVIGIPEKLQSDDREYYIIRAHDGEYTFMSDMDDASDTLTISTDMFSAYAIAYKQTDTDNEQGGNTKCGLCHICPTFLSVCYFIWLAVIVAVIIIVIIVLRRKKDEKEHEYYSD